MKKLIILFVTLFLILGGTGGVFAGGGRSGKKFDRSHLLYHNFMRGDHLLYHHTFPHHNYHHGYHWQSPHHYYQPGYMSPGYIIMMKKYRPHCLKNHIIRDRFQNRR